jgi:cytochrome c oxidase subunit 1
MHDVRTPDPASSAGQAPAMPEVHYLNATHGPMSWFFTKDHKRIALLYLYSVSAFFLVGGIFAMLIRLELATPRGDLLTAETYNKVFTAHGVVMVFFFLIPSIPAILGNFLVPIMIGAKDLAFPRINLASWYLYMIGGLFGIAALVSGGVDTGWTFYTPYSTQASNTHVVITGLGAFIAGFSSIFTGLNFIVTIHTMRAPGMTWDRLPLFIWSHYAASLIMITSSGSTPTRRSTSWCCPAWASSARSSRRSRASRCSATRWWPSPASASRWWASSCGATTCSRRASRCWPRWCSPS